LLASWETLQTSLQPTISSLHTSILLEFPSFHQTREVSHHWPRGKGSHRETVTTPKGHSEPICWSIQLFACRRKIGILPFIYLYPTWFACFLLYIYQLQDRVQFWKLQTAHSLVLPWAVLRNILIVATHTPGWNVASSLLMGRSSSTPCLNISYTSRT